MTGNNPKQHDNANSSDSSDFEPVIKGLNNVFDSVTRLVEHGLHAVNGVVSNVNTNLINNALPVDILETNTDIIVKAGPLVGLNRNDLDVSLTGDVLTIRGQIRDEDQSDGIYLKRERRNGNFVRTVKIPRPIIGERAAADFKNGVLIITLPKVEEAKPNVINIRTSDEE